MKNALIAAVMLLGCGDEPMLGESTEELTYTGFAGPADQSGSYDCCPPHNKGSTCIVSKDDNVHADVHDTMKYACTGYAAGEYAAVTGGFQAKSSVEFNPTTHHWDPVAGPPHAVGSDYSNHESQNFVCNVYVHCPGGRDQFQDPTKP